MLCKHFGLSAVPFMPEQSSFFESDSIKTGLLKLQTLIHAPQIALVSGKVGDGKTSLVDFFINSLDPMEIRVVCSKIVKPSVRGLFKNIAAAVGIAHSIYGDDIKLQLLNHFDEVRVQGKFSLVILDEAHTFPVDVLDQVKTFFDSRRNFSLILVGQPELPKKLRMSAALPLKQRISVFVNVKPLSMEETKGYVEFRLKQAGSSHPVFDEACYPRLFQYSEGVYRMVDQICFQALTEAFLSKEHMVTANIVEKAYKSLDYNF